MPPAVVVIMGVAGSGKTTVGRRLARTLGWSFRDGDDFHSARNRARMAAGVALTDRDRAPWLTAIRRHIADCLADEAPAVVACSALKRRYQRRIVVDPRRVKMVFLRADPALIRKRLRRRTGHFLGPNLLASQFRILEPPRRALAVDAARPADRIVADIRRVFSLAGDRRVGRGRPRSAPPGSFLGPPSN